jgi:hypothetical protein
MDNYNYPLPIWYGSAAVGGAVIKAKKATDYDYGDRYSQQNVDARKNSDGTIQPASSPKKLADGTFAPPLGRKRKGMVWDAVKGCWYPATSTNGMHSTLQKDAAVEDEIICIVNDEEGVSKMTTKPDHVTTAAAAAAASSSVAASSSSSSSSSSPPKKKKWRCDVCHVKLFDDYNTAIKHERTCKSWLKSGVAAMPLTAGEKEIIDDLATKAGMITTKPSRPHTDYTIFYQLEREFILHRELATDDDECNDKGTHNDKDSHSSSDPGSVDSKDNQEVTLLFENDPHMPARYRSLPLRADWYISGIYTKSKRKHSKSHGKIGFIELTRMIAARWAKVDDETKKYCKMMAAAELVKYKKELECYNQYKKRLSTIGEIPEDMKERMIKKQRKKEKKRGTTYTGPDDYVVI